MRALFLTFMMIFPLLSLSKTKFIPEVEALLTIAPLEENRLEDNIYIALVGIEHPEDIYYDIGKSITQYNYNLYRDIINNHKIDQFNNPDFQMIEFYLKNNVSRLSLNLTLENEEDKFRFPCSRKDITYQKCIDSTLKNINQIKTLSKKNTILLSRYQELHHLSHYDYFNISYLYFIPNFSLLLYGYDNAIANAIYTIDKGEIDRGFDLLLSELSLTKKLLTLNPDLIMVMIINRHLSSLLQLMDELLDSSYLTDKNLHSPKLNQLINFISSEERDNIEKSVTESVLEAIEAIKNQMTHLIIFMKIHDEQLPINSTERDQYLNNLNYYALANLNYYSDTMIQENIKNNRPLDYESPFLQAKKKEYFANNKHDNELFLSMSKKYNHYYTYINRFNNTLNYQRLLSLKLKIKQNKLSDKSINELIKKDPYALNITTKERFIWDSKNRILSTIKLNTELFYEDEEEKKKSSEKWIKVKI